MKSQFVVLAIVLAGLPALAWGQSCGCTSQVSTRVGSVRPASYGAWADYQPHVYRGNDGCGCTSCVSHVPSCGSCAPACCRPCCGHQLLCIIPNTVKKIGCALDCLIPHGPICCNSGCGSMGCTSGCPSCTSPASMGNPFLDDEVAPPMPPKPAPQESRRQPTVRA